MPFELAPGEDLRDSLTRCADEQLTKAIDELTGRLEKDPVQAIHAARKAIKKERALLRFGRAAIAPDRRASANAQLRDTARQLSGARDADVMIGALDRLADTDGDRLPGTAVTLARGRLVARREGRRELDRAATESAVQNLRALRQGVGGWIGQGAEWKEIEPGLVRTYRRGRAAYRLADQDPSIGNFHEWRKRVKDLWYELRLLAPVCGPAVRGEAAEAEVLSELLGEDHDLGVLRETLLEVAEETASNLDGLIAGVDRRRRQLQRCALLSGERMYAEKPRAFGRRLRRRWRAGRAEFEVLEQAKAAAVGTAAVR